MAKKKHLFEKGNEFWKQRGSHGRKPKFDDPETLRDACEEYFQWAHDTPLREGKDYRVKGKRKSYSVPKMRAMTIKGMCIFLDISSTTWDKYCEDEKFSDVTKWVRDVIYTQKFEGAAAGLISVNFIARDLGMKENVEINTPEMTPWSSVTAGVDES